MPQVPHKSEIIIYRAKDGSPALEVTLDKETVWLSQKQMGQLFGKDVRTINEHIKNVFKEGELTENRVIRKFRITARDGKTYDTNFYNLDVIISIGYRVKSFRGTQFRIWATSVLKDHILKGFSFNKKRVLELHGKQLTELEHAVGLVKKTIAAHVITGDEAKGLLDIITEYAHTWILLQKYDEAKLPQPRTKKAHGRFDYAFVRAAIVHLKASLMKKHEATDLFANERDKGLERIVGAISQTFGGKDLYPSIEEKASHLLYFVIKDHPFSDGNKRIGSFLFIVFLAKNRYLYKKNGEQKINDNALVALALLIAESDPKQKDLMIRLIMHFLSAR